MSCPRFVQNTWKRDLCSNCFKGKEDHAPVVDNRARYLASLKEITKRPPPPSILKGAVRKNVSGFKVHFPKEESQIIGYGGDEFSDNEDEEFDHVEEVSKVQEDVVDEEEDKNFQKLTESNTEFNKDPTNLSIVSSSNPVESVKKTTNTTLKLGQIPSSGEKKQTLLVSVQPFGSPANITPLAVSRKTHLNNLLHSTADPIKLPETVEVKPTATQPSMTKSETAGEIKTDESCDKEDNTTNINDRVSLPVSEISHVNKIIVDSPPECKIENVSSNETKKVDDDKEEKSKKTEKQAEIRLSSLIEGKKSQITRGTILTKSHEQAKTKRYFQLGPVKPDEESPISETIYKKLEANDNKTSSAFSKAKDTISIKTSIQHKNVKNIANGLFSSKLMKKEFGIQSDLPLMRMKSIDYIDTNVNSLNQGVGKESEVVQEKRDSVLADIPVVNFAKVLPSQNTEDKRKDEVLIIDGVPAESREMAGEPDGRADSDDLDEPPPDLPTTPPPLLTEHIPRPSFLHSIAKEKPKLPTKPKLMEKSPPKELVLDQAELDAMPSDPSLSPTSRHNLITKRQAPKPPPTPLGESPPKFTELEDNMMVRRDRSGSCSPLPSNSDSSSSCQTPEPINRRSLSLSNETLAAPSPLPAGKSLSLRMVGEESHPLPPPRPRPEIIHPLDLNKSGVQVLRSDGSLVKSQNSFPDTPSSPYIAHVPMPSGYHGVRPSKPPPPPRSQSLDSALGGDPRPARPPPPHKHLLSSQRHSDTPTPSPAPGNGHSVYVNIGEVRSAIAPAKPQRTASLREKDNCDAAYQATSALQMSENLYESLAPECDLSRERSSLPYYGSETESDIYCPYTFAYSQKGGEELRGCKLRSVVHKNLEDNYGAVVVANHEALTQLLEQVNQGPAVPASLRAIKTQSGLQWTDFTVESGGEAAGGRVFLPAQWGGAPVTLCLTAGQARLPACLGPVTQFFDLVASQFLHQDKTELVQVSIAVLVRQEFFSLPSFAAQLPSCADAVRESALLMVQVVNSLKTLQAQGREEASLSQFVVSREDRQFSPRVCLLPQDADKGGESVSLCQCAVKATELLSLPPPLNAILRSELREERATSLTRAKAALELWLWGPTHMPVSPDTQGSLQRWLDLERATVLHSLVVRRPLTLNCGDYCHLSFLVRTNAKVMCDALALLDKPATTTT
ncbi:uncharacterized protein LOC124355407 [Homalodisca vitripennis]|nr:uncharacterized protein LOC124355407 [Homalodisca vitripennis]